METGLSRFETGLKRTWFAHADKIVQSRHWHVARHETSAHGDDVILGVVDADGFLTAQHGLSNLHSIIK